MERVWCLVACVHRIGSPIDDSLLVGAVEWNLWTLDAHSLARVMITHDVFSLILRMLTQVAHRTGAYLGRLVSLVSFAKWLLFSTC